MFIFCYFSGFKKPRTTPTTTTPVTKTSKSIIDRIIDNNKKNIDSKFDNFEKHLEPVVPEIETVEPEKKIDTEAVAQQSPKDNSSSTTRTNQFTVLLMAMLSSLWFNHLSASS